MATSKSFAVLLPLVLPTLFVAPTLAQTQGKAAQNKATQGGTVSTLQPSEPKPQLVWTRPAGGYIDTLLERPDGRVNVYWGYYGDCGCGVDSSSKSNSNAPQVRYTSFNTQGHVCRGGIVPGQFATGTGIVAEDWNARGQHAYLPSTSDFLRLKMNGQYRVLRNLPGFTSESISALRFSPDGECLYVLSDSKLWIVGAQTGRLIRVVKPRTGTSWSGEDTGGSIDLSPDCRTILGMRRHLTLFSTWTGREVRHFANDIHTITGGCGDADPSFFFSGDGKFVLASQINAEYTYGMEGWAYPVSGGALRWHGSVPDPDPGDYVVTQTASGHFFVDTLDAHNHVGGNPEASSPLVLRRWRDGQVGWHLNFHSNLNSSDSRCLLFTRDGRWIYYTQDANVYRVAMPKF